MFITKWKYLLLLCFLIISSPAAAETSSKGRHCFDEAVKQATEGEDLQEIVNTYIDVQAIAKNAVWHKWRIRWNNLTLEQQRNATETTKGVLEKQINNMFKNMIPESLVVTEDRVIPHGLTKITGHYDTSKGAGKDFFNLSIRTDCKITRLVWNNILLSGYVASKFK